MTQRFSRWEDLSIRENLSFVARMYGMADRRAAIDRALDDLGLAARQHQLAGTLSGGWKQRLSLAACMLHHPRLLLLDEPTAGVDPKARRDFWQEIHALAARGISVLVSTHYMDEAERCHRLAYISAGTVLALGTGEQIVAARGLAAWRVTGPGLEALAHALRAEPGVDGVTAFGNSLHVTGRNRDALTALAARRTGLSGQSDHQWAPIEAGLEDVFISLMEHGA